jgi:hypothetical protein
MALPFALIPAVNMLAHVDGAVANAVAVAALPLVPAVRVDGSWVLVADPLRFENAAGAQLALPLAAMPVAQLLPLHVVGVDTNALAVAAVPLVLLAMEAGRSVAMMVRRPTAPAAPFGVARNWLAV